MTIKTAAELREQTADQTPAQQFAAVGDARRQRWEACDAILTAVSVDGRDMKASDRRDYDAHEDEIRRLDVLAQKLAADHPEVNHVDRSQLVADPAWSRSTASFQHGQPLAAGQRMTDYVAARGMVGDDEQDLSLQKWLRGTVLGDWTGAPRELKAMQEGTLSSGGAMVPTPLSAEVIDRMRNQSRVIQAGARTVPMESATLKMARVASDPSAAWHTESATITPSDGTLEVVTFTARALTSIVKFSLELLEDASGVDDLVKQIMGDTFALKVDLAALYGSGIAPEPQGVKAATGVTTLSSGANGAAPTSWDFLVDAEGTLADNNFDATAVIDAPRTERELGKLKDSTGQPLRMPDYIADLPRYPTNQVPINLTQGTSVDASDVFTADWGNLMIGVRHQFSVKVMDQRYLDTGEVGLFCFWRGDVQLARPKAFVVTTGVR